MVPSNLSIFDDRGWAGSTCPPALGVPYTTRCIKQDKLKKKALLSLVVKRKKSNKDNKQLEKLLNSV